MKVFISWSGGQSKDIAESLRDWLPDLLNVVKPFVSSQDIAKGERGLAVITEELEGSAFGMICVTRANQNAPWVNFEAGAISNHIGKSRVAPLLVDLPSAELSGPLREFQYTAVSDKTDMLKLVESVWEACPDAQVAKDRLARNFERFWPDLNSKIEKAKARPGPTKPVRVRPTEEKLDELLGLARQNHRRIDRLEEQIIFGPPIRKRAGKMVPPEEMRERQRFATQRLERILGNHPGIRSYAIEPHPDGAVYILYSGLEPFPETLQAELSSFADEFGVPVITQGPAGDRAFP